MSTSQRVQDLIAYVEQGKIIEAMHEFYAPNVEMQENLSPPRIGFHANLEHEQAFVGAVATVHENRAASYAAGEDHAAIHWIFDFTGTDGKRLHFDQIAYQKWENGKIVHERFFYDPSTLVR